MYSCVSLKCQVYKINQVKFHVDGCQHNQTRLQALTVILFLLLVAMLIQPSTHAFDRNSSNQHKEKEKLQVLIYEKAAWVWHLLTKGRKVQYRAEQEG